jgi:hypothetical protein
MIGGAPPLVAGAPVPGITPQFQTELKNSTDQQLKDMLKDPSLTDAKRSAIIEELARRKHVELQESKKMGNDQAGEDDDDLQALLKKYKEGKATPAEKEKLAKMLDVDVKDLDKAVDKAAPK